MAEELTESTITRVMDFAYETAVNGVAGMDSASEMAESYMRRGGTQVDQADSLIRWQCAKAGTSGFLTGLGGILVMPVTLPVNITSVIYVQIRMIAAIAHIGRHDLKDDRVKALVYACLTGNAAKDVLKDIGIVVGTKLTTNAIKNISGKTLTAINQKVGFRLLTKFGEKGAVNLGKAVPLVGGCVGATFDTAGTAIIGSIAKSVFIPVCDQALEVKGLTKATNAIDAARSAAAAGLSQATEAFRSVDLDGDGIPDKPRALSAMEDAGSAIRGATADAIKSTGSLFERKKDAVSHNGDGLLATDSQP